MFHFVPIVLTQGFGYQVPYGPVLEVLFSWHLFFGWEPPRYQTNSASIPGYIQMPKWKWSSCCVLCVLCGCLIFGRWSQHLPQQSPDILGPRHSRGPCSQCQAPPLYAQPPMSHVPKACELRGAQAGTGLMAKGRMECSFFKILSLI